MQIFAIIILLLSLTLSPKIASQSDDVFLVYILEYQKYYNKPVTTPITFGKKFEKNVIGYCIKYGGNLKEIQINKDFWDNTKSDYCREALIFHELAHCEQDRDHDNRPYEVSPNTFIPISLMNEYLVSCNTYTTYRSYYIQELFNN